MDTVRKFLTTFMSAVSNCSLYSKEHASVDDLTNEAFSQLVELLNESESLEIMIVESDLVVNKTPLREIGLQGTNFIKRLKRKGLSRIDILKGVTQPELKRLVAEMAGNDEGLGTSPHIKGGVIDVRIGGLKLDADFDMEGLAAFSAGQVDMVREVYEGISPFKKLNIAGLEEIVVNFIVTFRKEVNILKLISPVKSYSEYTYTHATNVAVLTMFQAETLGIKDILLRDIGIAALLHDVGKLFISKEILEKKGALDQREWQEIRLHPLYGARYLSKVEGLTRLAPVVALEHHLRYDGKGYPKLRLDGKKQHICSQIVAISDYFDALRSRRPYRRALEMKEIISIMRQEAAGGFNIALLDHFVKTMHSALSQ
jgi:HD-GYP domain-containing protein (c-di-GMP phosphodiesterase class II)